MKTFVCKLLKPCLNKLSDANDVHMFTVTVLCLSLKIECNWTLLLCIGRYRNDVAIEPL